MNQNKKAQTFLGKSINKKWLKIKKKIIIR